MSAAPSPVPIAPGSGSASPALAAGVVNGNGVGAAPSTSGLHHNVVPSEVGWQFVPQYYTFVNKSPNRLHKFYTRNSTFIHGTEGEEGRPCYGQQEIHQRIMQIGFQDCKVFIHSVDAQSSAAGGIIIQVIGEMSTSGEPYRKFAQTFFLAEQPNGYFVLNDIFRFLKEDTGGEEEEEEPTAAAAAPAPAAHSTEWPASPSPVPAAPEPVVEPPREPTPPPAEPAPVEPAPAVEPAPEPEPEPVAAPADEVKVANGHVEPATAAPAEPDVTEEPPAPVEEPTPAEPAPAPTPSPKPTPAAATPPAPIPLPVPAAPSAEGTKPAEPPKPKTWATLAASGPWGAGATAGGVRAVSVAAKPVPKPPVQPTPPAAPAAPRAASGTTTPVVAVPDGEHHPNWVAAMALTNGQCFVKGVTEGVSTNVLKEVLTTRFGPIKELDIVRSKACAFLEFTNTESARRAVISCLPLNQGGEGGIRIEGAGENGGPQRITVEARKERGDRPPPRPHRGGAPIPEAGRGAYRGRGAPPAGATRGRGVPAGKV